MDEVERIAHERKPKLILAGWSAYPRFLDFERFRAIADEVGAYLVVDMAHFAGLVAAGEHPSPVPLRRRRHLDGAQDPRRRARRHDPVPRGVRQGDQLGRLPGPAGRAARAHHRRQGGGLPHRRRPRPSASASSARWPAPRRSPRNCSRAGAGVNVLTGGTDVHLVLVDLRESELDGQQAEDRLHDIGITVNRNAVPFDPRPPMVTSGLRVGAERAGHPRPAGRRLPRGRAHHRRRAVGGLRGRRRPIWPSASRPSRTATRSTSTWRPRPLRSSPAAAGRRLLGR